MLEKLLLTDVGPAEKIDLVFTSRLNLLTGNNSLGKTFVLDIAWWVLTHNWAGLPARPRQHQSKISEKNSHHTSIIKYTNTAPATTEIITQFDPKNRDWV
jgi:predicted ATP-binding protein involved in virulence